MNLTIRNASGAIVYFALFSAIVLNRDVFIISIGSLSTSFFAITFFILIPTLILCLLFRRLLNSTELFVFAGYSFFLIAIILSLLGREFIGNSVSEEYSTTFRLIAYSLMLPMSYHCFGALRFSGRKLFVAWWIIYFLVVFFGMLQVLAVNYPDSIFAQYFLWENIRGGERRVASLFRWQGPMVIFLSVSIVILLYSLGRERGRFFSFLILISLLFGILVLLMSGSRTVLPNLLLLVSVAPFLLNLNISCKILYYFVGVLGVPSLLIVVFARSEFDGSSFGRIFGQGTHIEGLLDSPRFQIWGLLIESVSGSVSLFVFGLGAGASRQITGYDSHSGLIEILTEHGILGLLGWCVFLFSVFFTGIIRSRVNRTPGDGNLIMFVSCCLLFFIYLFSASAIHYPWVYLLFGGLLYFVGSGYYSGNSIPEKIKC